MNADGLLAMLRAMNPKAKEIMLSQMDETSKISIILMDLFNRMAILTTELNVGPWTTMKLPGMLSTVVIDSVDTITRGMVKKREKEGELEGQESINKVAEKILKEMEGYERDKGQSKNPRAKGTSSRTPRKTNKNVH